MSDIERLECAKCNSALPGTSASPEVTHRPCPQCGSTEKVVRLEFFDEAATPRDRLEGKVRNNGFPSTKSIRQEFIYGFDKRRSRGDYVYKERDQPGRRFLPRADQRGEDGRDHPQRPGKAQRPFRPRLRQVPEKICRTVGSRRETR
jgi:hypothetical protein